MKTGLRAVALFTVYATIGYGGDYAVGLLSAESSPEAIEVVQVDVKAVPNVVVDVKPTVVSRVQVRHMGECSFRDERRLVSSASGVDAVSIDAGAGELHVEGREGLEELVVVGMLCASHEEYLEALDVSLERRADGTVHMATHYPRQRDRHGSNTARVDLTVLVPLGMDVEVDDSSGDITVIGTGDLEIDDSSGSIRVSSILGSLDIDDSSGSVSVNDVAGDAVIDDSAGSLDIQGVEGSVLVSDGAGGIDIAGVGRNVVIESDGAGSIDVRDVAGDFTVERDGNGSIRHSGVEGRVDVPVRRRRGG